MKFEYYKRGKVGWCFTVRTCKYRRTLWVGRPHLTKMSNTLEIFQQEQERKAQKARKRSGLGG